jgi:hypothetical protein
MKNTENIISKTYGFYPLENNATLQEMLTTRILLYSILS